MQIDMWSLGCILCELYTGQPIFPGEDERDQLNYIMEYLDVPSQEYINASRKRRVFFDNNNMPLKVPNSQGHIAIPNTKSLNNALKGSGQHFIDFIKECLKWNPNERITPENALMHKFIISDMNYETLYQHKIKINRMKIGMGRNVIKSAKSSLNSNRSSNYSISKPNKNESKRNLNNNNNSDNNSNTIDKKKISVSIDKECNKDKAKLNKIEETDVEGIQQSRSVDKKTWGFKDKEEDYKEKKGSKTKGKKDGKECNEKSNKNNCNSKGNNNGKVKNNLQQG
jgi:dual specificity tyrosine-phosphorylation-regulated kinase 2/3/4